MQVIIDKRGGSIGWDESAIRQLALFALAHMRVPDTCEVSISLVGPQEIQQLNREYRGVDSVTDVLSFPCDDPWDDEQLGISPNAPSRHPERAKRAEGSFNADDEFEASACEPIELGDVVMCCDVIDEQRTQFGMSFEQEASLMLVHSILHLLGYDHMESDEAQAMEALEKEILDAYGLVGIR